MSETSEEVKKLDGKEGNLVDIVKSYLDSKKANYTIVKAGPEERVAYIKDVEPFVEQGSVMIEKNGKKVIIEELTKICGMSGRFHERNNVKVDSIINRPPRILFRTFKDKKDLYIHSDLEAKQDTVFGPVYIGGGEMSVTINDILKEPSKIPKSETYEINCKCEEFGKLKCRGRTWKV